MKPNYETNADVPSHGMTSALGAALLEAQADRAARQPHHIPAGSAPRDVDDMTAQELDALAKRISGDRHEDSYYADWLDKLESTVISLCNLFTDDGGDEGILANKLADYITHFFDRELEKIYNYATDQKAELAKLYDAGPAEVNEMQAMRIRERLNRLREQYSVARICRDRMLYNVRPKVFANTGIQWNDNYRSPKMHRLQSQVARLRRKMTSDLLESDRPRFLGLQHQVKELDQRIRDLREAERSSRRKAFERQHAGLPVKEPSHDPDDGPSFDLTACGSREYEPAFHNMPDQGFTPDA